MHDINNEGRFLWQLHQCDPSGQAKFPIVVISPFPDDQLSYLTCGILHLTHLSWKFVQPIFPQIFGLVKAKLYNSVQSGRDFLSQSMIS